MVKSIHVHICAHQITIKLFPYTCVCALLKATEDYVAGDEARPPGVVQNICPNVGERAPHSCHRSLPLLLAKRLPEQRVARRSPVGHARKGSVIRLLVQRKHVRVRRERPSLTRVRERGAQLARAADGSTSATANEMRIVSVAQVVVSMLKHSLTKYLYRAKVVRVIDVENSQVVLHVEETDLQRVITLHVDLAVRALHDNLPSRWNEAMRWAALRVRRLEGVVASERRDVVLGALVSSPIIREPCSEQRW